MKPILLERRSALLDELRTAVDAEDYQQESVDELRKKIDQVDARLDQQKYLDEQSRSTKPTDEQFRDVARGYDIRKAILGVIDGKLTGREAEINTELRSRDGNREVPAHALLIPDEVFERRTLTSPDTSAGKVLTEDFRPGEFLKSLRPMSVASAAGVRMFAGAGDKVLFPKQNAVTKPSFTTETGSASQTDISFSDAIEFTPKRMAWYSGYSEQLIRQTGGGLNIHSRIVEDSLREAAIKIDELVFVGGEVSSGSVVDVTTDPNTCLLYTSPSPRD